MGQAIIAFLSSTSRDLREHRSRVQQYCERFGYGFRVMEEFGAQDGSAVSVSLSELDGCQIFVGVYARRYGYVPPGADKGVTELEYDEAERLAIPRLLFVIAPEYAGHPLLETNRDDADPAQADRLRQFLDRVGVQRVWDTFTTPEHLASRVAFAVSKWEGWRPPRPVVPQYSYVGREEFLRRLDECLIPGRRVALVGLAGIGKTLTAAVLANRLASRFSGGVFWIGLGTEARDPDQVLQATIRAWAVCHHPGRLADPGKLTPEVVERWFVAAPGPVLVVIDDIWHARVCRELLRMVPETAALLVTTRRADVVRQLGIEVVPVDRLARDEAVALLRDRVGDMPSLTTLRRIADLLAGHPLALEIVAAQIASGSPDLAESMPGAIAARLQDDEGAVLGESDAGMETVETADQDIGRYASLSAALGLTYDIFPEDLKRRFRATGPLAPDAPLSELLLATIWGDDLTNDLARLEFISRTTALVSASIFDREGTAFTRHALVRLYALEKARQAGDYRAVEDRYVAYILDLVIPRLQVVTPERWDAELGDELPHVHFVGDRLVEQLAGGTASAAAGEMMVRFANGVERYLEHRREVPGVRWLEAAATACAEAGNHQEQVRLLNALAGTHFALRDSRKGLQAADQAWQIAIQQQDQLGQARAALFLGYHYTHMDPWEAPRYVEGAVRQFEAAEDKVGLVDALIHLASIRADHVNSPLVRRQGLDLLDKAVTDARSCGYQLGEVRALCRLGELLQTCAEYPAARNRLEEAVSAARGLGSQSEEATALLALAGVLADLGDFSEAADQLDQAVQLFETVGDLVGLGTALRNAAQLAELMGNPSRAAESYAAALPFIRKRTSLEIDHFDYTDMRAIRTLTVRLDDVLFYDTREQYRAKADRWLFEEDMKNFGEERAKRTWGTIGGEGPMPEDVWGFLARQTIGATVGKEGEATSWASVLEGFARRLDSLGAYWAVDADFARFLADIASGRPVTHRESHTYSGHIRQAQARVERRKAGGPFLSTADLQYFCRNAVATAKAEKGEVRKWTALLRRLREEAITWGDSDAADFFNALLGIAVDRLASVLPNNPYADAIRQLEAFLSRESELLLDYLERKSIAVKLIVPSEFDGWCATLAQSLDLATLWKQQREQEYLKTLLAVLNDQPSSLPADHVYGSSIAFVAASISLKVKPANIPFGQIRQMFTYAKNVDSSDPKGQEVAVRMFGEFVEQASKAGNLDEMYFFKALQDISKSVGTNLHAENPYHIYLEHHMGFQWH